MTDIAQTPSVVTNVHTNPEARARLKGRYGAEFRFRALGLGALLFACLFLVIFLSTIVREGFPAFFQNYVAVDVTLDRAEIDPNTTRDPAVIGRANYDAILTRSIRAAFPEIQDRQIQRALASLVSSGAPVNLRQQVLRHPEWIGTRQRVYLPLDDLADLYLKGRLGAGVPTALERVDVRGDIGASGVRGTVQLSTSANNFQPLLAEVKLQLRQSAARARTTAGNLDRAARRSEAERDSLQTRIATSGNAEERERLAQRVEQLTNEVASLRNQITTQTQLAVSLEQRSNAADQRERLDASVPSYFVRMNGGVIKLTEVASAVATGSVIIPLQSDVVAQPGQWRLERVAVPETNRRFNDAQLILLENLRDRALVQQRMSNEFFLGGASREAELAGVWSAIVGSFMTLAVTLLLSFPIGVAAAIYLEEFAPKNAFTEAIEVNINNLAAVPSIIFGLLGLAIFLNAFGLPRSAPIVGGMVLALMTLPIIIIASRAALKAVPPSIKQAALGLGASHVQAVTHHVLPLAMPGILTGTILGMAHALGETAPLLMIGMVAFVVDVPTSLTDPATLLPVQIFMWADFPEVAFQQKTAAAIMILLVFLVFMNGIAIYLRKRFERRW